MELISLIHSPVLKALPPLSKTEMGELTHVTIVMEEPGAPGLFSVDYSVGLPQGRAHLQCSFDLGVADPCATIASVILDSFGDAVFRDVADPRPEPIQATRAFCG